MKQQKPKELTLCKNCWCETKTIDYKIGKCGKCGQTKYQKKFSNLVKKLLTKQRTELKQIIDIMWDKKETDKNRYSVGWNSALAELEARLDLPKVNTRTELLEEIKKKTKIYEFTRKEIIGWLHDQNWKSQELESILLQKKNLK